MQLNHHILQDTGHGGTDNQLKVTKCDHDHEGQEVSAVK